SLAEASEARKVRLTALRKQKAGEVVNDQGYLTSICGLNYLTDVFLNVNRVAEPVIKNRNFDPESRTLKKHTANDIVVEDTVENQVKGMAVQIIADDERRRAQELVRFPYIP